MKTLFLVTSLVFLTFSCKNSGSKGKQENQTPKALQQGNGSSFSLISKRSYNDLIDELYKELLEKDPDLKKLEERINQVVTSAGDSTEAFSNYISKNQSYFTAAQSHIKLIQDSLLRQQISERIQESQSAYNSLIGKHSELNNLIEAKNLRLDDLHNILKILKTLPIIEKYQKENLPSPEPLKGFANEQDKVLESVDSVIKKL